MACANHFSIFMQACSIDPHALIQVATLRECVCTRLTHFLTLEAGLMAHLCN